MAKRNWGELRRPPPRVASGFGGSVMLAAVLVSAALLPAACASPGEPTARKPVIPEAVSDLAATQQGNLVRLTFRVPRFSAGGRPLEHQPTIELFRDFEPASGNRWSHRRGPQHPTLLVVIPSELTPRYCVAGQFRYFEPLQAGDFTDHPHSVVVYSVRTRLSDKRLSAPSNLAALHIDPAADPIDDLMGQVTQTAVVLSWTPPKTSPLGALPSITGYRIYRGQVPSPPAAGMGAAAHGPGSSPAGTPPATLPGMPPPRPPLQHPLMKVGETKSPEFSDKQAAFGKTYIYSVRSVLTYSGSAVESSDSNFLQITPRDTFPPAAPTGLIGIYVPGAQALPAHVDLSWAVSQQPDVAGYRVYRSEAAHVLGTSLDTQRLLTPAFRDMKIVPGRRYYYAVVAVDRSGNQSAPSTAISVQVPAVAQPGP